MHFSTLVSGFLCASVAFSRPTLPTDDITKSLSGPTEGESTTPSADSLPLSQRDEEEPSLPIDDLTKSFSTPSEGDESSEPSTESLPSKRDEEEPTLPINDLTKSFSVPSEGESSEPSTESLPSKRGDEEEPSLPIDDLTKSLSMPSEDDESSEPSTESLPSKRGDEEPESFDEPKEGGKSPKEGGKPQFGQCYPTGITPYDKRAVVKQFATDMIVPDLIERINPTVNVSVTYLNTDQGDKGVYLGTYFTPLQTLTAPSLNFSAEKNYNPYNTKYVYFLVDPDVPQNGSPAQVNFLHWMVYNASPSCAPDQSTTGVFYQPLTPASTTQHRYTFLVYRQPPNYNPQDLESLTLQLRTPFDLNDYTQDEGLVLVGGNFLKEAITNGIVG